ncbi:uncharacterized protein LOC113281901 [Papaver somniferum]|nr:uncharacterized protein LOC113281901 [Papaver somniferum]
MKDLLQEFRTWVTIEDMRKGFNTWTTELLQTVGVDDQEKVVKDMKEFCAALEDMYKPIKRAYDDADKSYSEVITTLISKHPYVVHMPWFDILFSDMQKVSFDLYDETIADNNRKMPNPSVDLEKVMELQRQLQRAEDNFAVLSRKVKDLSTLISSVKSLISFVQPVLDRIKLSCSNRRERGIQALTV